MRSGNRDEAPPAAQRARCWGANHGKDFRPEIEGGYLWCAKGGGRGSVVLDNMARAAPGEVVFSFAEGRVGAVGLVSERQRAAPAPGARPAPARRAPGGWLLPVRFAVLGQPLVPGEHMDRLGPVLPAKHAPLRAAGARSPAPYLAEVPARMAAVLEELLGGQLRRIEEAIAIETDGQLGDAAVEEQIWRRSDLALRDKRQLIAARRGQGVFRLNVEGIEKLCRVTGVPDRRHLRASHIKPWKLSDDRERLDGSNGLLLSPHIEHLFERGHISFADDGRLLVSKHLNPTVAKAWGLDQARPPRPFRAEQRAYLEFHRRQVFERVTSGRRT
ncbi:MAG TPA: HNH endonuclease [Steroidobacteraceae bacterium]|nr:HNH endonuclease [Steroidobacteraceae bacterium]